MNGCADCGAFWRVGRGLSIGPEPSEATAICELVTNFIFNVPTARIRPVNTTFFGEMLQTIAERGRALLDRTLERRESAAQQSASLIELCEQLLSGRGEASGVALAREILGQYAELTTGPRIAFFEALAKDFGPDHARLNAAIEAWRQAPSDETTAE